MLLQCQPLQHSRARCVVLLVWFQAEKAGIGEISAYCSDVMSRIILRALCCVPSVLARAIALPHVT